MAFERAQWLLPAVEGVDGQQGVRHGAGEAEG